MNQQTKDYKSIFLPFSLTCLIIILDQVTKALASAYIDPYVQIVPILGDFLQLIHVYNTGAAFSLGHGLSAVPRIVILGIIPLILLVLAGIYYYTTNTLTQFQRWCFCGILGGGFGNLIDRFFNPNGVVDFIDVKFYGLFGFERWPTFNLADSAIVVCGLLLACSIFFMPKQGVSRAS